MTTRHIGRIVIGCLTAGPVVALGLVVGPLGGAQEHVITGTVLLALASSWALLATLSMLWTDQPQRWAAMLAGFMGLAGAGLIAFAPSGAVIGALGWVWPPLLLALLAVTVVRVHRDLHSRTRSWVVYPLLGIYALSAIGASYQTIRESIDRRVSVAPGQLVDVGGHRLHLRCTGLGTPTVILESGLGETAAYWGWISTAVAQDTKVCVYDRAGRGWSDPSPVPQDGVAVARDLHILLDRAQVPAPFVLVGHSSGAQYVRIFAGRYPEQVVGMVLLDGQPAEAFEGLPNFPAFYKWFRRVSALFPSVARLGFARLAYGGDSASLPERARSLRDEFAELPTAMAQARSFQSLGDRPLVVVTAARGAQAGWLPLQDEMAKLSTNSRHQVVPYEHVELVTDETAARTSSQAIRDVVRAVRSKGFSVALRVNRQ
ncbi:MAG: alpha/beta hydrolase [Vicinamibacterales bacterium]